MDTCIPSAGASPHGGLARPRSSTPCPLGSWRSECARCIVVAVPDLFTEAEPAARGGLGGKVAVVTGGGSGVGRAVAMAVARQGASVVVADFDEPRMERTVEEVLKLGSCEAAIALSTDIRNDASVRSLARDSIKSMGRGDILVNAAGVLLQGK